MAVATYDPKKVLITIAGFPVSGFADGTFVVVERDADSFNKTVGADGEVARALTNNKTGTFTLTLLQSSSANAFLSALVATDEVTGDGVAPIQITDKRGLSTYFSAEGWVRKPANAEFSNEITNREWVFDLAAVNILHLGN